MDEDFEGEDLELESYESDEDEEDLEDCPELVDQNLDLNEEDEEDSLGKLKIFI